MSKQKHSDIDFDLPIVETTPANKARVHISDDTCVACEG